MKSNWDISGFIKKVEDEVLEDVFNVIGAQSVTWASENLRRNKSVITKNLLNSLAYATEKTQSQVSGTDGEPLEKANKKSLKVGTSVVYAGIVEFGGTIKPKNAKALTIPLNDEAKRVASARDIPDLVLIKPKHSVHPLLVRMNGDGTFVPMFLLVTSVTISAKPYLRPIFDSHKNEILAIMQSALT